MGVFEVGCMISSGFITISWDCGPLPCPKFNWKDLAAFIVAAIVTYGCFSILPELKNPLTSMDAILGIVVGVAFGRFIKRVLCPIPVK